MSEQAIPVIIDTDPGIDDAVALALAVRSPELHILGVTITFGNTTRDNAFRNARYVLDRFGGTGVPVFPGAKRPLVRPLVTAPETHGEGGLGYLPPPEGTVEGEFAPLAILRMLRSARTPVTIIAIGPLTNLALALAQGEEVMREKVAEIVLMGGSAGAPGNTTPVSEFNFWADPEAARAVLQSGIPIRMVGLDVTRRMVFPSDLVERLRGSGQPDARFLGELLRFYVDFHREYEGLDGCIVNDPLAVALVIDERFGQARPMYVEVSCADDLTRGQSICDRYGFLHREPNARVYLWCDPVATIEFVLERVVGESVMDAETMARSLASLGIVS